LSGTRLAVEQVGRPRGEQTTRGQQSATWSIVQLFSGLRRWTLAIMAKYLYGRKAADALKSRWGKRIKFLGRRVRPEPDRRSRRRRFL
jgi:hypothetical protein